MKGERLYRKKKVVHSSVSDDGSGLSVMSPNLVK
jgi:hypothetical protein